MQHRVRRTDGSAGMDEQETGGAIDLPQAFPDEAPAKLKVEKRQRKRKTKRLQEPAGSGWMISFGILVTIVVVSSYYLVKHHEKQMMDHLRSDIFHDQVEPLSKQWEEKYALLEEENEKLKREAKDVTGLQHENEELKKENGQFEKLKEQKDTRIERLVKYKKQMQENLQLMSKTILLEK